MIKATLKAGASEDCNTMAWARPGSKTCACMEVVGPKRSRRMSVTMPPLASELVMDAKAKWDRLARGRNVLIALLPPWVSWR